MYLRCAFSLVIFFVCVGAWKPSAGLQPRRVWVQKSVVAVTLTPALAYAASKAAAPTVFKTDAGVQFIELEKGDGARPRSGDIVVIDYTGYLFNGTVFDSTEVQGRKALAFTFGKNQVIPGWEDVLQDMRVGGHRQCVIPAKLAYGAEGVCLFDGRCIVPPNETLKFDIKLRKIANTY